MLVIGLVLCESFYSRYGGRCDVHAFYLVEIVYFVLRAVGFCGPEIEFRGLCKTLSSNVRTLFSPYYTMKSTLYNTNVNIFTTYINNALRL